jgi:isopentenyldiphosphate isomerase
MTKRVSVQVQLVIAVLSCQLGILQGFVSRPTNFQQRSNSRDAMAVMPSASSRSEEMEQSETVSLSLAGQYLVQCSFEDNQGTWSLVPLSDAAIPTTMKDSSDGKTYKSQGARAWAALHSPLGQPEPSLVLQCQCKDTDGGNGDIGTIRVTCTGDNTDSSTVNLVPVLSRLLLQWTIWQGQYLDVNKEWKLELPYDAKCTDSGSSPVASMTMNDWTSNGGIRKLFASFLDATIVDVEMVEMVDRHGNALGILPRKLVHTHNLLHRGIGMFVTKDQHIMSSSSSSDDKSAFPDLYVHRRTDTKRIFPSLYDMFVGGVSTAGEDLRTTACREVAEELGLVEQSHLSEDPIFSCIVCTTYNRCLVTLYCYQMDTSREQVSWQEEEVAWGEFVPYVIVQAAADRSIQRFQAKGEWPGSEPPIQSASQGAAPADVSHDSDDWMAWDFVPDGLLVWEAWLQWLDEQPK